MAEYTSFALISHDGNSIAPNICADTEESPEKTIDYNVMFWICFWYVIVLSYDDCPMVLCDVFQMFVD